LIFIAEMGKVGKIKKIDATSLKKMLSEGKEEFIAIFSTEWCGYCRSLMNELGNSGFNFKIIEVDISSDDDSAWDEFNIGTVPTAVLFRDGVELDRRPPDPEGLRVKSLKDLLEKNRAK
jgi:thiol-disulfide isomerase/thioredoxin